jgi:hypothetical protein
VNREWLPLEFADPGQARQSFRAFSKAPGSKLTSPGIRSLRRRHVTGSLGEAQTECCAGVCLKKRGQNRLSKGLRWLIPSSKYRLSRARTFLRLYALLQSSRVDNERTDHKLERALFSGSKRCACRNLPRANELLPMLTLVRRSGACRHKFRCFVSRSQNSVRSVIPTRHSNRCVDLRNPNSTNVLKRKVF